MEKVVTRIPPSPTGHLHIGTVRTALYNFLFAKKHKGRFVMRSEDTDRTRSTKAFEEEIVEGLAWLHIEADEFVRQSERGTLYRRHLERIIGEGRAYISKEESRQKPGEIVEVIRLKNPNKVITFTDEVRGEISFDTTELQDFVIARSIDDALYHFAVVVDDHEMGITHVIRGEDHISNTPRQILIQEAIDAPRPIYAHLPLILAPDRSKLSKRHGAVALYEYRNEGFLPQAIINYLALLGWNPGTEQELFSMQELVNTFSLEGVQKGGAIFSKEKLRWFNREYVKQMSTTTFLDHVRMRLPEHITAMPLFSKERLERLLPLIQDRTHILIDITKDFESGEYDFAFTEPACDPALLKWKGDKSPKDALPRLERVITLLSPLKDQSSAEKIKETLMPYAEKEGKGEVLWPLRVALTNKKTSPDPFSVIVVLGVHAALERLKKACATMQE